MPRVSLPILESIQVGMPERRGVSGSEYPNQREWFSGIVKRPVIGPVHLGATNLEGDGQADLRVHGGPNRAVLCYCAEHYPIWREELGDSALPVGIFGENFTISGLDESTVRLDDIYRIGESRVQVSQLRGPCWKLARNVGRIDIVERVLRTGRSGWYVRVLTEGMVRAGDAVELEERAPASPTMLEIHGSQHWRGDAE